MLTANDDDLPAALRRMLRTGSYFMRRLDQGATLSTRQLATLNSVVDAPRTMGWIAQANGFTQAAASQLVRKLESGDLVTKRPDPTDGRGVIVEVTPRGECVRRAESERRDAVLADMLGSMSTSERAAIAAALPPLQKLFVEHNEHIETPH